MIHGSACSCRLVGGWLVRGRVLFQNHIEIKVCCTQNKRFFFLNLTRWIHRVKCKKKNQIKSKNRHMDTETHTFHLSTQPQPFTAKNMLSSASGRMGSSRSYLPKEVNASCTEQTPHDAYPPRASRTLGFAFLFTFFFFPFIILLEKSK